MYMKCRNTNTLGWRILPIYSVQCTIYTNYYQADWKKGQLKYCQRFTWGGSEVCQSGYIPFLNISSTLRLRSPALRRAKPNTGEKQHLGFELMPPPFWGHIFGSIDTHCGFTPPYIFSTPDLCISCRGAIIFPSCITVQHKFWMHFLLFFIVVQNSMISILPVMKHRSTYS